MSIEPKHYKAELTEGTRIWVRMDNGMRFDAKVVKYNTETGFMDAVVAGASVSINMDSVAAIGRKLNQ